VIKRKSSRPIWRILFLLLSIGLLTTCGSGSDANSVQGLNTWLLVSAPETMLPVGQPVEVRSRTEDADTAISHVELYAVQVPNGQSNVLIRSDVAPFQQTAFTASQIFTPLQAGRYAIKVVGYNIEGDRADSDTISFEVGP